MNFGLKQMYSWTVLAIFGLCMVPCVFAQSSNGFISHTEMQKNAMDALAHGTLHNIIDTRCDEKGKEFLQGYLDQIHNTLEFNRYIYFALKDFKGFKINPYEQAVISGCLDMVTMIDNKSIELSTISMRSYLSRHNHCNSPLHLAVLFNRKLDEKGQVFLDRSLIEYLSKDKDNVFLINADNCTALDLITEQGIEMNNFYSVKQFLHATQVERRERVSEATPNIYLENCLDGYQRFTNMDQ